MKVLIQFQKNDLLFARPVSVISCFDPSLTGDCFKQMEEALAGGYYLAGFLSYEAGYSFEEKLFLRRDYGFPLLCFGVYRKPEDARGMPLMPIGGLPENMRLNTGREEYAFNIGAIRDYIAKGDVYQITYCLKLLFDFRADSFALYRRLLKEQPVPYPAYIECPDFNILSLSPELFIRKEGQRIETRPMKGTWPRGTDIFSDLFCSLRLKYDLKNRAENVMIADLLRNDMGRLASDIRAPRLFEVARYKTLCQMTSTVTARIEKDIPLYRLFSSLFPSGSVTGAPKIRAMEIIRQLEKEERQIYTGTIGYISPEKDMFFNIPIRTLLIRDGRGQMGIGGGIVWDSTVSGEWEEGLLKAKFLTDLAKND
ncbi:MAG: chorismate-binding protein [Candidatus Omnitrophica bacterium]|nr:chorismate-binding protein [Candidatus Omnitrophota bacterium]